jgi:hypothetical protein
MADQVSTNPKRPKANWLTDARDGAGWANQKNHNVEYLTKGSGSVKR